MRFLLAMIGIVAWADGVPAALNPTVVAAETRVALGFVMQGTQYGEGFGGVSDRESGMLPGFTAEASRLGPLLGLPGIYSGLVYDFAGGPLSYNGFIQGHAVPRLSPYDSTDHARFNTVEVRLGRALTLSTVVDVVPFVAAGYQTWYRDVGGAGGYAEFYRAGIAGAGARFDVALSDRLVISATAAGFAVVRGRASAPALGFAAEFGTSGEETVHLGADWELSNALHLFAGLGVRHFNYAGSALNNGFYEPPSSTLVVRSEVGVAFGFQ
ncbi:hypothetical protein [Acidiphilium sp. PA]|uniref:hypothetical protein n=1 Tax=Acidiphilium sp. PA TaxID=2871705 RepID=UPI002243B36F|nr:hypothetical protein [Acidiphilium sp. PA]